VIHRLTDHLLTHWQAIVGDRLPEPRSIHLMKFGSVTDFPRKYIYMYAFLDDSTDPALVLKITADRSAQSQLVREFDMLNRIRAKVSPEVAATIPEALAGLPFGSYWIGVEEVAGGKRFVPVINLDRGGDRQRVSTLLDLVLDWSIAFGRCGLTQQEFDGELMVSAVTEPLARLRSYYDIDPDESAYLDELGARFEARRGSPVTTVASHGDLWPGNLYVQDGGLRIIDWTGFRERDVSYHDLFNFIDSFVVRSGRELDAADPSGRETSTHTLFNASARGNWFAELAVTYVDRYIEGLELDRELVQLMLPMYYVAMATRREPVNEASVAVNHKFRGLLAAYIQLAGQSGGFSLPGPWDPSLIRGVTESAEEPAEILPGDA
jgi:hypothetical protein